MGYGGVETGGLFGREGPAKLGWEASEPSHCQKELINNLDYFSFQAQTRKMTSEPKEVDPALTNH